MQVDALPVVAKTQAGSFWTLFAEKSVMPGRQRGRKALRAKANYLDAGMSAGVRDASKRKSPRAANID